MLEDGDALVLDKTVPGPEGIFGVLGHFPAYVLTRDGKVQDVYYHYRVHHKVSVPFNPHDP